MKPLRSYPMAAAAVCAFSALVLIVAFITDPYYPVRVIAGESSVGAWLSGAMLIAATVLSLVSGMGRGWFPWLFFSAFFSVLALDERFMFHEQLKERIIFKFPALPTAWHWLCELPVIIGGCIGALVALMLWRHLRRTGRILLLCAAFLGVASVTLDVLCAGVFWEDSFKICAELLLVCALLGEIDG